MQFGITDEAIELPLACWKSLREEQAIGSHSVELPVVLSKTEKVCARTSQARGYGTNLGIVTPENFEK
jgi:hypothetical protein